jgi:alkylation response protein AidB-like acyl-CoA dehydrogenase
MRLDLDDAQRDIQQAVRDLLASRDSVGRARAMDGAAAPFDAQLWDELCELGWPGIAIPERHDGRGLGLVELAVVLEEHGRGCAPTPLLGAALAGLALVEAGSEAQQDRWLGELGRGAPAAFGFTHGGNAAPLVGDAGHADVAVLIPLDSGPATLVERPLVAPADTIDATRAYGTLATDIGEPLPGDGESARDHMLVAVAAELVGLGQRALDTSVEYARDRRQFGTPIGAFQSVAHLAAEMYRDVEGARWATRAAAAAIDLDHDDTTAVAAVAAAAAADAAVNVTSTAIQLHGAIGFTWEADVHLFYKRAHATARLIAGSHPHRARALRAALARRPVPETA